MNTEPRYEDYEKMIYKSAWYWHYKTGADIDDLIQEGFLTFHRAKETYNPESGACFSTWLHHKLRDYTSRYSIGSIAMNPHGRSSIDTVNNYISNNQKGFVDQERKHQFKEMLTSLSNEAKEIIELIFNSPSEFTELALEGTRRISPYFIKNYLLKNGWGHNTINKTLTEIKNGLNEIEPLKNHNHREASK